MHTTWKKKRNMCTIGFSQCQHHQRTKHFELTLPFFNQSCPLDILSLKTKPQFDHKGWDSPCQKLLGHVTLLSQKQEHPAKKSEKKKAKEELSHSSTVATGLFSPSRTFNCQSDGAWLSHLDQLIAPNAPFKRVLWCGGAPRGDEMAGVVSR